MRNLAQALEAADRASTMLHSLQEAQAITDTPLPLGQAREALSAALELVVAFIRPNNRTRVNGHKPRLQAVEAALALELDTPSVWDPDPAAMKIEVSRCRALLLQIIVRAAHDWVLYRTTRRLPQRAYAEDAYAWLFIEHDRHPDYRDRLDDGHTITSFLVICEELDLDVKTVRDRLKEMDVKMVISAGRPAERRRKRTGDDVSYEQHDVTSDVSLDALDTHNPRHLSRYESQFATNQLGYL